MLPSSGIGFGWGDQDVQIVLRRKPGQDVHVVDMRGQAITDFSLFAFAEGRGGWVRYGKLNLHGHHPGGHVQLTGLSSGTNAVLVVPKAPGLGSTAMASFVSDGSMQANALTVAVPDQTVLSVELRDSNGLPVALSRVELLQSVRGSEPDADSKALDVADCDLGGSYPSFLRQASETTDPSGLAEMQASPGTWYLRITGDSHMPHIQQVEVAGTPTSLPVTVHAGCSVSGTVGPASALKALAQLSPNGENPVTVELNTSASTAPAIAQV